MDRVALALRLTRAAELLLIRDSRAEFYRRRLASLKRFPPGEPEHLISLDFTLRKGSADSLRTSAFAVSELWAVAAAGVAFLSPAAAIHLTEVMARAETVHCCAVALLECQLSFFKIFDDLDEIAADEAAADAAASGADLGAHAAACADAACADETRDDDATHDDDLAAVSAALDASEFATCDAAFAEASAASDLHFDSDAVARSLAAASAEAASREALRAAATAASEHARDRPRGRGEVAAAIARSGCGDIVAQARAAIRAATAARQSARTIGADFNAALVRAKSAAGAALLVVRGAILELLPLAEAALSKFKDRGATFSDSWVAAALVLYATCASRWLFVSFASPDAGTLHGAPSGQCFKGALDVTRNCLDGATCLILRLSPHKTVCAAVSRVARAAARLGDAELVKTLTSHGHQCRRLSCRKFPGALSTAAERGHLAVVQALLSCQASLDASEIGGLAPALRAAAHNNHAAVVAAIVNHVFSLCACHTLLFPDVANALFLAAGCAAHNGALDALKALHWPDQLVYDVADVFVSISDNGSTTLFPPGTTLASVFDSIVASIVVSSVVIRGPVPWDVKPFVKRSCPVALAACDFHTILLSCSRDFLERLAPSIRGLLVPLTLRFPLLLDRFLLGDLLWLLCDDPAFTLAEFAQFLWNRASWLAAHAFGGPDETRAHYLDLFRRCSRAYREARLRALSTVLLCCKRRDLFLPYVAWAVVATF